MSLTDSHLNSNAFDDVDAMDCDPTTRITQMGGPVSPWTASLPPDIMGKIFVNVRDMMRSYHPKCQPAWLRLTRVCRSWRQVALDTPALWTDLRMYDIKFPEELEELLSRSGDHLVHLELNFVKRRLLSAAEFEVCIKLAVALHGHRIASFDVFCFTEDVIPIQRVETILSFPNGVEVFLEPWTSYPGSVVRLQGGGFPQLSELCQDGEASPDAFKVFHAVGKARRHNPVDHAFWQAFGLRIPLVLRDFSSLTHLHLEYCGPRDRQGSVMENIFLPPGFRMLAIKDEPWEMQTLLSHISFGFAAEVCKHMRIKLAVDLQNPMYRSQHALQGLLRAIQWPSIYYHVSVCTTVLLNLTSDYTLTLAGFDIEQRPKFQFDFFNGGDRSAILELAAGTLNNYFKIFAPLEAPLFSDLRQLSIHDASGELGHLLDWDTLLSCLPLDVRSISLGNARVVAQFLDAMDRLAQAASGSGSPIKAETVRLSRLAWCVDDRLPKQLSEDVAIIQRCRALGILDVEEIVLRVARQVDSDEPGTPNDQFSPLPSPPPSSEDSPSEDVARLPVESKARIRIRVEDSDWCSICHRAPRPSKKPVQRTDVEPDIRDPRTCPPATAMDAWDNFAGVWEDHIWNMAASYKDADWTYMSA